MQVIAYVSGRTDLLMALFVLAAFYLLLLAHRQMDRRLVVLALVSYALALLAKETAALFPFFCLAWFVSARLAARTSGPRPLTPAPLDWLIFATLVVITTGYPHHPRTRPRPGP